MKLVKTVKCKLQVTQEQRQAILETIDKFTCACNDALAIARKENCWNRYLLHNKTYYLLKERYNLTANYVIRAIGRVCAKRKRKPTNFKSGSLDLDKDLFRFNSHRYEISLASYAGRLKHIPLDIGNYQRGILVGQKPTVATLIYRKQRQEFYINIVLEKEVPTPKGSNPVGVDRGLYNLATTTNGFKFSGKEVMHKRRKFAAVRSGLQAKGTKSARRTLKRLSGREGRYMTDVNHRISKQIVQSCQPGGDVIVMEDLRYIRERIRAQRRQRYILHSWAFGQLQFFVEYKALEKGVAVSYVDPHYTSQSCSVCGQIGKRNAHHFSCLCGYSANADVNAAFNIARVYSLGEGLLSTSPKVSVIQRDKPTDLSVGS